MKGQVNEKDLDTQFLNNRVHSLVRTQPKAGEQGFPSACSQKENLKNSLTVHAIQ